MLLAAGVLAPFFFEATPEVRSTYQSLGKIVEDRPMQVTFVRAGVDAGAFGRFVNPKLLITAYCRSCGLETDIIRVGLHRIELYYEDGEGRLLPLSEAGSFV